MLGVEPNYSLTSVRASDPGSDQLVVGCEYLSPGGPGNSHGVTWCIARQ